MGREIGAHLNEKTVPQRVPVDEGYALEHGIEPSADRLVERVRGAGRCDTPDGSLEQLGVKERFE